MNNIQVFSKYFVFFPQKENGCKTFESPGVDINTGVDENTDEIKKILQLGRMTAELVNGIVSFNIFRVDVNSHFDEDAEELNRTILVATQNVQDCAFLDSIIDINSGVDQKTGNCSKIFNR